MIKDVLFVFLVGLLIFAFGIIVTRHLALKEPHSCVSIRHVFFKYPQKGHERGYVPQCTFWGDYMKQQCDRSKNTCWCVNEIGSKIVSSETPYSEPSKLCHLHGLSGWLRKLQE